MISNAMTLDFCRFKCHDIRKRHFKHSFRHLVSPSSVAAWKKGRRTSPSYHSVVEKLVTGVRLWFMQSVILLSSQVDALKSSIATALYLVGDLTARL